MRVVVALGGNALLRRGERPDATVQLAHVRAAAHALAPLAREHELLICHGNGPQVGLLALESQRDEVLSEPYPLDALGAQTQGMIGYWLAQALHNEDVGRPVVTVVTQTLVDPVDPAFDDPAKPVGPGYDEDEAGRLAALYGWRTARDGDRVRRVVASPRPTGFVELAAAVRLLETPAVVICAGGGGAPVTTDAEGRLTGVEAVVDKDHVATLLAEQVDADRLLVLTDVSAVMTGFGTSQAAEVRRMTVAEARAGTYAAGSMGPKVEACATFAATTGRPAAIGSLEDVDAILAGRAGTTVG